MPPCNACSASASSALPFDVLWQSGARYHAEMTQFVETLPADIQPCVRCVGFIDRMDLAYQSARVIASRAGAMSIAELALIGKPTISGSVAGGCRRSPNQKRSNHSATEAALSCFGIPRSSKASECRNLLLAWEMNHRQQTLNPTPAFCSPTAGSARRGRCIGELHMMHYYFVGIGGIGMSGLARYFHAHGAAVSGYDRTASTPHRILASELGISVCTSATASEVDRRFRRHGSL